MTLTLSSQKMDNNVHIVQKEYQSDPKLKKENVIDIVSWLRNQPHLPTMIEQEILWFLRSCYYNIESTKIIIEKYFIMKTSCRELLGNRCLELESLKATLEVIVFSILPEKTPDGSTAMLSHLIDTSPQNFELTDIMKLFDMMIMADMFKNGSHNGLLYCLDMKGVSFAHVTRIKILTLKNFLNYLQECMPIRLKGLHFFNVTSIMDTILKMIKPFMKSEVVQMIHLHQTVDSLSKFVPLEYLPSDFGGTYESLETLHDQMKISLGESAALFAYQDEQLINEAKRIGRPKTSSYTYGVEGTFKKLELD